MLQRTFLTLLLFAALLTPWARAGQDSVLVIPIRGGIDPGMAHFVQRTLQEARGRDHLAVLLEVDTFGGRVDSALEIQRVLMEEAHPTIAFVRGEAWSAGALIALAADKVVMAHGSSMGAAEPRIGGQSAGEKEKAALRSAFRATAERQGRPVELAEAMVDASVDVPQAPAGKLLSVSAEEAVRLGLADFVAENPEQIFTRLEMGSPDLVWASPGWSEELASFLAEDWVSAILLIAGMVALAVALGTPGMGAGELATLVCFGLFFGSRFLAGMGWWLPLVLLLAGLALLAIEVLVIPGTGITGVLGLVGVSAGVILSFSDWQTGAVALMSSLLLAGAAIFWILKYLPENRLVRGTLILKPEPIPEPDVEKGDLRLLLGRIGVCRTPLRPGGIVDFEGQRVDVVTEGEFAEKGARVECLEVVGTRVVVRPLESPKAT